MHYPQLHYITLHLRPPPQLQLRYFTRHCTRPHYIAPTYITLHRTHYTSTILLQVHYTNYTTPQLQLHYIATTAALHHHTQSSSCGWGDHCNHCNHSNKYKSNRLWVNQWIRSAIRDSQQPTSPIGFLFWNFRRRLVRYYWWTYGEMLIWWPPWQGENPFDVYQWQRFFAHHSTKFGRISVMETSADQ